jgi:cysteine synthase B
MAAAMRGYRMILIMPENQSVERCQTMRAFGAELVLTPKAGGMEGARPRRQMMAEGKGIVLDQFANPDNPLAHYEGTGPEIWRDTQGRITHFVSSMGTTGTIMGCSRFFKEKNPADRDHRLPARGGLADPRHPQVAGGLPAEDLRRLAASTDRVRQARPAEEMTRRLAREEGIFAGISSGGAMAVALRVAEARSERGDRHHRLRPRRPLPVDGVFPA